jgi:hypothetical protein
MRGHEREVTSLCFNSDGTRMVTASEDGTIRFWDTATGKEVLAFPGVEYAANGFWLGPGDRNALIELGVRRTGKSTDDSLFKLWVRKEDRGPEYRTAKAKPRSHWHKQRALEASVASAWFTTAFHAALSLQDRPEDSEARKLLQQAWHELDDGGRRRATERYEQAAKLFPTRSSEELPRSLMRETLMPIGGLSIEQTKEGGDRTSHISR